MALNCSRSECLHEDEWQHAFCRIAQEGPGGPEAAADEPDQLQLVARDGIEQHYTFFEMNSRGRKFGPRGRPVDELACQVVWWALHQSERAVGGGEQANRLIAGKSMWGCSPRL